MRPGDNVWNLAGRYLRRDVPWQRLQQHNGIDDPHRLVPGSLITVPVRWLKQQPAKASVIALQGAAMAVARDGTQSPVREGMALVIGMRLRTAAGASLTLQFADGSRLLLQADSELILDKLSAFGATGMVDTRLRLPRGRATNAVKHLRGAASRFIIETPHALSSVRGTQFRVGSDGAHSQAEVLEGSIAVSGGGAQVMVRPGQGTASGDDGRPLSPRALLPAPESASITPDTQQLPARLAWNSVPGASAYRVQISPTPDFLSLAFDRVSPDHRISLDGVGDGTYSVRVRAIDAAAIEGRDAVTRLEIASHAPFMVEPVDGAQVTSVRPRFRWASMPGAMHYRVQLADTTGFDRPLIDMPALTGDAWRVPNALAPGEYAWRVAAVDAEGRTTAFSDPARFRLAAQGEGPRTEPGTTTHERNALHVRWAAARAGQRFRFQLARDAGFTHPEIDREVDGNEIVLTDLRGGTWYSRVQTLDSDGYAGEFGPAQQLKLGCRSCRWLIGGGAVLLLLAL